MLIYLLLLLFVNRRWEIMIAWFPQSQGYSDFLLLTSFQYACNSDSSHLWRKGLMGMHFRNTFF
jgi:hypothetical protein